MSLWYVNPGKRRKASGGGLRARLQRKYKRNAAPPMMHTRRGWVRTTRRHREHLDEKARERKRDRAVMSAGAYSRWGIGKKKNPRRKKRSAKQIAATKRMIAAARRARRGVSNPGKKRKKRTRSKSMAVKKRKRRARAATTTKRRKRRRAARTTTKRRRRRARSSAPKRRRRRRAAAVAAPKRRRRRRARATAAPKRRRRRRSSSRRRGKRRYGVRALRRARRTIRHQKRRGSGIARSYMRRYKMRSNPGGGGLRGVLGTVIPVVVAMGLGRLLASKVAPRLPFMASLGQYADPALSAGMLLLGHFATNKVAALRKYRTPILIGLGVNAALSAIKTLAPGLAAMVGLGDSGIYDGAMAGYQYDTAGVGEYVQVGEFGEYIQVAGDGMGDTSGAIEQLAGSGSPKMLAPVGVQQSVAPVPDWTPEFSQDGLQTGIFANGF